MRAVRTGAIAALAVAALIGSLPLSASAQTARIVTGADLTTDEALMLRQAVQAAELFLDAELDAPGYGSMVIFGSHDPAWLSQRVAEVAEATGFETNTSIEFWAATCSGTEDRISGRAGVGWGVICWPGYDMDQPRIALRVADRLVPMAAHELAHAIQTARAGHNVAEARELPRWFREGVAEDLEERYTSRGPRVTRRSFPQLARHLQYIGLTLDEMDGQAMSADDYAVASFAVRALTERGSGDPLAVWTRIAEGATAEEAFEAEFGISLADFVEGFEQVRRDPEAITGFATGD